MIRINHKWCWLYKKDIEIHIFLNIQFLFQQILSLIRLKSKYTYNVKTYNICRPLSLHSCHAYRRAYLPVLQMWLRGYPAQRDTWAAVLHNHPYLPGGTGHRAESRPPSQNLGQRRDCQTQGHKRKLAAWIAGYWK